MLNAQNTVKVIREAALRIETYANQVGENGCVPIVLAGARNLTT